MKNNVVPLFPGTNETPSHTDTTTLHVTVRLVGAEPSETTPQPYPAPNHALTYKATLFGFLLGLLIGG